MTTIVCVVITTLDGFVSSDDDVDDGETAETIVLLCAADSLWDCGDVSDSGTHLIAIPVWLSFNGTARQTSF